MLSRDGTVLGTRTQPNAVSFPMPADTGRYTLALTANRTRPWTTLSTKVSTTWTFTSGPPAVPNEWLALPTVKVTSEFDRSSRARGGAPFTLCLTATTQVAAAPSAVTVTSVEFSGDDGVTWQAVPVRHAGGNQWRVRLTNPAAGFVSLRVRAATAAGDTLEQTIIRAYGLTA